MRYVCLVFTDEARLDQAPASAIAELEDEWRVLEAALRSTGVLVAGEALLPPGTATTVRVRGDAVRLSDGPSVHAREQLSSFCVIDARDLNDAVRIAAKLPSARYGAIEVRPVRWVEHRHGPVTPEQRV